MCLVQAGDRKQQKGMSYRFIVSVSLPTTNLLQRSLHWAMFFGIRDVKRVWYDVLSEWQGNKVNDSSWKQRVLQAEDILEVILITLVHLRDEENEDQTDTLMFVQPVNYRGGIRNPVLPLPTQCQWRREKSAMLYPTLVKSGKSKRAKSS